MAFHPYLFFGGNCRDAFARYQEIFGGEPFVMTMADAPPTEHPVPPGKEHLVMHAALKIGDSQLMLNDEMPEYGVLSPLSTGGNSPVTIHIYTENVDEAIKSFAPTGVNIWWETLREPDFDRAVGQLAPSGRMILMAGREARPPFPVGLTD